MASDNKGLGDKIVDPSSVLDDTAPEAVASAVLQIDERTVKAYQKDIDTLLLVAGLFSAVLTPLLVESYHSLRQEPTETMVLLLRQIARQTDSFTVNDNFVNATSTVPIDSQSSAFTPTPNAKRVNILWFASLVLSLATASLCINVKQWLAEYLSQEYIPPLVRLRIRNFRYRGLTRWKVLEIAAILPLFLQVSVTLFLVGLCYFTLDVHKTVGYTTYPLVIAWGVFFVLSMFTPILWTECPWKTPYLRLLPFMHRARHSEVDAAHDETDDVKIFEDLDATQQDDEFLTGPMWKALISTPRDPDDLAKFVLSAIQRRIPLTKGGFERSLLLSMGPVCNLRENTYIRLMQMVADVIRIGLNSSDKNALRTIGQKTWLHACLRVLLVSEFEHKLLEQTPGSVDRALRACLKHQWRPHLISFIHANKAPGKLEMILQRLQGAFFLVDTTLGLLKILNDFFPPESLPPLNGSPSSDTTPQTCHRAVLSSLTPAREELYLFLSEPMNSGSAEFVTTVLIERARSVSHQQKPWKFDDLSLLVHIFKFDLLRKGEQQESIASLVKDLLVSPTESNTDIIYNILLESDPGQDETWEAIRKVAGKCYRRAFWQSTTTLSERSQILYHYLLWSYAEDIPDNSEYAEYSFERRMEKLSTAKRTGPLRSFHFFLQLLCLVDVDRKGSSALKGTEAQETVTAENITLWKSIFAFLGSKLVSNDHPGSYVHPLLQDKIDDCRVLIRKISSDPSLTAYHVEFGQDLTEALQKYDPMQESAQSTGLHEMNPNPSDGNSQRGPSLETRREKSSRADADDPRHPSSLTIVTQAHSPYASLNADTHDNLSDRSPHSSVSSRSRRFSPFTGLSIPLDMRYASNGSHSANDSGTQHVRATNSARSSPIQSMSALWDSLLQAGGRMSRSSSHSAIELIQTPTSPAAQHETDQTGSPAASVYTNPARYLVRTHVSPSPSIPTPQVRAQRNGDQRGGTTTVSEVSQTFAPNIGGPDVASSSTAAVPSTSYNSINVSSVHGRGEDRPTTRPRNEVVNATNDRPDIVPHASHLGTIDENAKLVNQAGTGSSRSLDPAASGSNELEDTEVPDAVTPLIHVYAPGEDDSHEKSTAHDDDLPGSDAFD